MIEDNETEQNEQRLRELRRSRHRLRELSTAFEAEAGLSRPISESNGDVITHDYEDTDFAALLTDRDLSDRLLTLLDSNRDQVEHAMERLQQGLYGICEDCGDAIPAERLEFKPEATRCVRCQGRWDREHRPLN
ncbi:MAG: TraR/DksA C4-type zinc finger protein [Candidatus Dormibacteraeota bacterium]|nr:TraR/DksA C4-type zinc finger protein [Candidatus Dormibacteraeota bacterium]MBO0743511.1 TraR/DksA C4-type zinc finger protein [Candidatus Dormibacteraeota bacterium]